MAYSTVHANNITTVDCHKQVRSWRLLRSLIELLIPTCNRTFVEKNEEIRQEDYFINSYNTHYYSPKHIFFSSNTNITGTIFGSPRRKVNFCIQTNPKSTTPALLLELAISTKSLAREMRSGLLRIALVSNNANVYSENDYTSSLLSTPVWTMYCNGRKVGFAIKRKASKGDVEALRHIESVNVGAGIINGKELERDDDDGIMYLRGNFKRVHGSNNSETFHLIDPEESSDDDHDDHDDDEDDSDVNSRSDFVNPEEDDAEHRTTAFLEKWDKSSG